MELVQMEYFAVVARLQHVTRAAEQLNITQPALSHSIAKLEEELGVPLFERSGRNVQLNRYGEMFAGTVEKVLQEVERGKREIAELAHPETGTVAFAFLNILGSKMVPGLIRSFQSKYPGIRFELEQGNQQIIRKLMDSGKCDLALTAPRSEILGYDWAPLYTRNLFVVVPRTHPLADRDDVDLHELKNEPFIENKAICGFRTMLDKLLKDAGFRPNVRYEAEDLQTVAGFVSEGLGISVLPDSPSLQLEGIRWLPVRGSGCVCTVGLEWKNKRYLSPAARLFRDFLIQEHDTNTFAS